MIEGILGLLWIFPIIYFLFGKDNVWWVFTIIEVLSTLVILTKTDWVFDRIEMETKTKGNDVYWLYDMGHKEDK